MTNQAVPLRYGYKVACGIHFQARSISSKDPAIATAITVGCLTKVFRF